MQAALGITEDLKVRQLKFSTYNPRVGFGQLDELLLSIHEKGLLQPLVVRPTDDRFEVVAGNRRLEACRRLGYRKVPCHIVELDDKEALEVALTENIQRRSLHPLEEAEAFRKYVEDYGWGGVSELARSIGKSQAYVSKRLQLLNLPENLRNEMFASQISPSVAEELISLKDNDLRERLGHIVIAKRMNTEETRALVKMAKRRQQSSPCMDDEDEIGLNTLDALTPLRQGKYVSYRILRKSTTILRTALMEMDDVIGDVDENWILRETLMEQRRVIHELISSLIKARKKLDYLGKRKVFEPKEKTTTITLTKPTGSK